MTVFVLLSLKRILCAYSAYFLIFSGGLSFCRYHTVFASLSTRSYLLVGGHHGQTLLSVLVGNRVLYERSIVKPSHLSSPNNILPLFPSLLSFQRLLKHNTTSNHLSIHLKESLLSLSVSCGLSFISAQK